MVCGFPWAQYLGRYVPPFLTYQPPFLQKGSFFGSQPGCKGTLLTNQAGPLSMAQHIGALPKVTAWVSAFPAQPFPLLLIEMEISFLKE